MRDFHNSLQYQSTWSAIECYKRFVPRHPHQLVIGWIGKAYDPTNISLADLTCDASKYMLVYIDTDNHFHTHTHSKMHLILVLRIFLLVHITHDHKITCTYNLISSHLYNLKERGWLDRNVQKLK